MNIITGAVPPPEAPPAAEFWILVFVVETALQGVRHINLPVETRAGIALFDLWQSGLQELHRRTGADPASITLLNAIGPGVPPSQRPGGTSLNVRNS